MDLIKRQDAIDAVDTIGFDFSNCDLSQTEREELCEAIGEVRQTFVRRISNVTPAQQWIPVIERLPEKDVKVLFLWKRDENLEYDVGSWSWRRVYTDDGYGRSRDTGRDVVAWYGLQYWHKQEEIYAWMPLPEPYESEDKE